MPKLDQNCDPADLPPLAVDWAKTFLEDPVVKSALAQKMRNQGLIPPYFSGTSIVKVGGALFVVPRPIAVLNLGSYSCFATSDLIIR